MAGPAILQMGVSTTVLHDVLDSLWSTLQVCNPGVVCLTDTGGERGGGGRGENDCAHPQ